MQLPLLHRSTQMAVLKKLIRRKVRELRRRKNRAQHRLDVIRQFRSELLRLMQRLIDLQQRDAKQGRREQARREVSGMLHMYKRWLGNWTRSIKAQGRLIREQEQLKRRLSRRLRLLRKRLRNHHSPKHLVDRCFEKLAKAVKRWQQRPDYHQYIEDQELIWMQEVEEVRRYLSEIRSKPQMRRKSPRRTRGLHLELQHFGSFWKSGVVRRRKKLAKFQAPPEVFSPEWKVYRVPKPPLRSLRKRYNRPESSEFHLDLGDLDEDQKRSRGRISSRKLINKDSLGHSVREMQKLVRMLKFQNPSVTKYPKSNRNLKRKAAKTDLYQELEKDINNAKPKSKHMSRNQVNLIVNRLHGIGSAMRSVIQESRKPLIKRPKKHKWPANFRRKIPVRHKYADLDGVTKHKFVNENFRKENEVLKSNYKRDHRRSNTLSNGSFAVIPAARKRPIKTHHKKKMKNASSLQSSDDGTDIMVNNLNRRKTITETSLSDQLLVPNSVAPLSASVHKLITASRPARKSVRKSIFGLGLPTGGIKPKVRKTRQSMMESTYQRLRQMKNMPGFRLSDSYRPRRSTRLSNRFVVSAPLICISDTPSEIRDPAQNGTKERSSGTNKESITASRLDSESAKDVSIRENTNSSPENSKYSIRDLDSDGKYKQIQFFLKDVIESNPVLDHMSTPNVQQLMKAVGKHYMWGNLQDLHGELLAGGISKSDVKQLLSDKYLKYLRTILNAQTKKLDSVTSSQYSTKLPIPDQLRRLKFWYRHRMSTLPLRIRTQGKKEQQPKEATKDMNDSTFKKIFEKELNAERAKRDKWDDRLRRLLPSSQISASMSFTSTNTVKDVEPEEEEDLRTIDERYSIRNLMKMMNEHKVRFRVKGKFDSNFKLVEKPSEGLFGPKEPKEPKEPPRQSSKKIEQRLLSPPIHLYYSPRKTCREQQVVKLYSEYSADEEEYEDHETCAENCPLCGVNEEVSCFAPLPKVSSAILSSGSIEACAKNKLLLNTIENVCTRCGYVHDEAKPCTQPPEERGKTMILRLIK
ncbi:hypothetical protein KR038_000054, partial [Drosophila bunnanda]